MTYAGAAQGSHHTNDIVLIRPIFWRDQALGFATIMVHHRDVGVL
jgi:N-methylhydantoinase B/oxoprolinase/acetone carboxylase alpha subunit